MPSAREPDRNVNLAVTNYSGGKRHTAAGAADAGALAGLVEFTQEIRTDSGFVLAIQEMTSAEEGLPTQVRAFEAALKHEALTSFVPRVSTDWYPIRQKWGDAVSQASAHSEGLCIATSRAGLTIAPWSSAPWPSVAGPRATNGVTRILDLPNFGFPDTEPDGAEKPDWTHATYTLNGDRNEIVFRPTYYHGSRDSDPRVAQLCLLGWSAEHGGLIGRSPACLIVNLHLSTLTTELRSDRRGRTPNTDAIFLRGMQLQLIARFIRTFQEATHGMPVVVAGDFNSSPDSPEMQDFSERVASPPQLGAEKCWKCGTVQREREPVYFYASHANCWDFRLSKQITDRPPELSTTAVCSNDSCLEPRFTHKGHGQLLDNIFIIPAFDGYEWGVMPGTPRLDVSRAYSDHAAIVMPLHFARR